MRPRSRPPTVLSRPGHGAGARRRRTTASELEKYQAPAEPAAPQGAASQASRRSSSSRAGTRPARAARSAASPRRSTPATTRSIPIAAPTDEEHAHHYLWRFWRSPAAGPAAFTIFDRSWYGRVLVERVEGFATEDEWRRAYAEINDFEQQLVDHGIVLVKFWIHITTGRAGGALQGPRGDPVQALEAHRRGLAQPRAVGGLRAAPSTTWSSGPARRSRPGTLVEGNDKRYARIKVLETLCDALERALDYPLRDLNGVQLARPIGNHGRQRIPGRPDGNGSGARPSGRSA